MSSLSFRFCALVVALCLQLVWARSAAAEDRIDKSVALATDGLAHFNRGAFAEAYDKFYLAEQLAHSPVFSLYLARSKAGMSELLAAREHYRAVVEEQFSEGAPQTWHQAKRDARAELAALEVPVLHVDVTPTEAAITIDGRPAVLDTKGRIEIDPGEHRVIAIVGERRAQEVVVVVAGAAETTVSLVVPDASDEPSQGAATAGLLWPGIAVTSLGVVGIGVGAVLGGLALSLDGDLATQCDPNGVCPPPLADDLDRLDAYELGSTIGLVAGGVVAALGVTLLVWRPGGSDAVSARISPHAIDLAIRF